MWLKNFSFRENPGLLSHGVYPAEPVAFSAEVRLYGWRFRSRQETVLSKRILDERMFFVRYGLVGLASFCVDSGTYWSLLWLVGEEYYLLWYAMSHLVVFGINFAGHKFFTYRGGSARDGRVQIASHALLKVGNFAASVALLYILVSVWGAPPIVGLLVNAGFAAWSLVASAWIFAALHPIETVRALVRHATGLWDYARSFFFAARL